MRRGAWTVRRYDLAKELAMDGASTLFRPEAVAAQTRDGFGAVVLDFPASLAAMGGVCATVACALAALLYFGSYTAHSTLHGRVTPEHGVIEVASPQAGTLVEKRVVEGQRVAAGDILYVVSSERLSSTSGATQRAVGEQLGRRRASLVEQIEATRELEKAERASVAERLGALRVELARLDEMLAAQAQRLELLTATVARHGKLRELGFLAEEQWRATEAELLEQRGRLRGLEREQAVGQRLRAELEGRSAALELEYANEVAELERAVAATDLDIAENDARRAVAVAAPQPGTVTGAIMQIGQRIEGGQSLCAIVPLDASLIAELYAPSRAVGFVAPGAEVRLRYAAFPYQKFGHGRGTVATISQTTLAAAAASTASRAAPVYRIVVTLESQTVPAYNVPRPLLPGMEVEADVLLDTRRLYEWVLEPLYAMAARLER
jgi:membrane fusion protein